MDAKERVIARFKNDVAKGLADVKFFIRGKNASVNELYAQADCFEEAAAAGPCKEITEIDRSFPKTKFDAPFI